MSKNIAVICFVLLSAFACVSSAVAEEPKLNPVNNHWYEVITADTAAPDYWQDLEQKATLLNGHLATINDAAEQEWVFENIINSTHRNYWIGLNDSIEEGKLTWVSGEDSTYSNWASAWHNTASRDYAFIRQSDGKWDLGARQDYKLGIAEWHAETTPEPVGSSLLLLGGCLLVFVRRWRRV